MAKTDKTKIIVITSAVVVGLVSIYAIANRNRKIKMIKDIEAKLKKYKESSESSGQSQVDIAKGLSPATLKRSQLPINKVTEYGKKIYEAKGYTYDNEDVVYSTIKNLKNQVQVAQISGYIESRTGGVKLMDWLPQWVDKIAPDGEYYLDKIRNFISNLPKSA